MIGYVDLTYADNYVATHYLSTDDLRTGWENLSEADKEVLLLKSFESIDRLPFTGRKTKCNQDKAFPRWPSDEVPDDIKAAQVENALSLSNADSLEDAAFYEKLWQYGVESYSIGNLSERTSSGSWGRGVAVAGGIVSAQASKILSRYISGSYSVRGRFY